MSAGTLSPTVALVVKLVAKPDEADVVPPKSWRVSYAASGLVLDSLIS